MSDIPESPEEKLAEELADLEEDLQDAINVEDYNLAAKLRDRINEIANKLLGITTTKQNKTPGTTVKLQTQTLKEVTERLSRESEEKLELFSQLQRVSADFSNFQKRTKKDKERWTRDATRQVLTSFLPAFDNLDSVLDSLAKTEENDSLKQGLSLVEETFRDSLAKFNVTRIQPAVDDKFDPELHKAISIQHDENAEFETIAFVTRPGYKIDNAVIRPAEVVVKKKVYS